MLSYRHEERVQEKIRRVKTRNHDLPIFSFPWECYKVNQIGDDVYELYQADCNDPEAKRKSKTSVTINVKKRGYIQRFIISW